jgi:hypothetical protein
MSKLREMIKEPPIHERSVQIRTYPFENNRIIVEGWLRDEWMVLGYQWDGTPRPTGVIHWMCARFLLGNQPLTILDAEAEMPAVPHQPCSTALNSIKKVIGLTITSGFTEEVRNRLGGSKGCSHLTYLITAMGPASLQGFWVQQSRQKRPIPSSIKEFASLSLLIDSCRLWRKNGPLLKEIKEKFKGIRGVPPIKDASRGK